MAPQTLAYYLALGSCLLFSFSSLLFADISRKISPLWMNAFKAGLALVGFAAILVVTGWTPIPPRITGALLASGTIGLGIGDVFLLIAYARMGAARGLILWGFQPVLMAIEGYLFFHQELSWRVGVAVLFLIVCLFIFSLERFRQDGHWELIGLVTALLAMLGDNGGIVLSRWAFDSAPDMDAFQANFIRCVGAMAFFFIYNQFHKIQFVSGWKRLGPHGRLVATSAAFLGTFLSLCLFLAAIRIGHLASLSAMGASVPVLAAVMESIYLRKRPSLYLLSALGMFLIGFFILVT